MQCAFMFDSEPTAADFKSKIILGHALRPAFDRAGFLLNN